MIQLCYKNVQQNVWCCHAYAVQSREVQLAQGSVSGVKGAVGDGTCACHEAQHWYCSGRETAAKKAACGAEEDGMGCECQQYDGGKLQEKHEDCEL